MLVQARLHRTDALLQEVGKLHAPSCCVRWATTQADAEPHTFQRLRRKTGVGSASFAGLIALLTGAVPSPSTTVSEVVARA